MMTPSTDIEKLLKRYPALEPVFKPVRPLTGIQPIPTTGKHPYPRVIYKLKDREPLCYPMWPDVESVLKDYDKMTRGFEGIIFMAGIGLGYLLEACLRKPRGYTKIGLWEPNPEMLRYACYVRDLTNIILHPGVTLIVGGMEEIRKYFEVQFRENVDEVFLLCDNELNEINPKLQQTMQQEIHPLIDNYRSNRTTLMAFRQHFALNILKALPTLARSRSVKYLKDLASGFPAIVCGSGPSLRRHYEALANFNMNQEGVILSADSALKPLLAHNIHPDFVCSVDPQPETFQKYLGLDIPNATSLIYHPGTASHISSGFQGERFFCGSLMPPMDQMKHIFGDPSDVGSQIQCQTHFAVDLAQHMGCDPIILVGMDLCYYENDLYADTAGYLANIKQPDINVLKNMANPAKDQFGNDVQAPQTFIFYIRGFSDRAKKMNLINCSEQGMDIPGAPNRLLRDVLHELVDGKWICVSRILECLPPPSYDLEALLKILVGYRKDLRYHQMLAKNILKHSGKHMTLEDRKLVSLWTNKAKKRMECLHAIVMLAASGMVHPPGLKEKRYDFLSDSIQAAVEQTYCNVYYEWMASSTNKVLPILEEIIADLRIQDLSQVPALADADRRLPE